jgi:serine/threonine-protein kinase OSR1/STK39
MSAPNTESTAPPEEWPTSSSHYQLVGKIGVGAFATVYRAKTDDNRQCAVKVLNLDHVDSNLAEIRLEVQAMKLSSHENVLCCHTAFVHEIHLWLVTQLMRKGSSLHCLQAARKLFRQQQPQQQPQQQCLIMEPHIFYILHETLLGLKYIHDNGQIHRDVKAGNILLGYDGSVRIADFGVSGWLVQGGSQVEKAKTFVGTPCWMARKCNDRLRACVNDEYFLACCCFVVVVD